MAYKIQYSPENARRYPQVRKQRKFPGESFVVILIVLAAAVWIRLNGIPDFLIPGDPEVTRAAAAVMITDLRQGIKVDDAVTTFCKEILHGAGY